MLTTHHLNYSEYYSFHSKIPARNTNDIQENIDAYANEENREYYCKTIIAVIHQLDKYHLADSMLDVVLAHDMNHINQILHALPDYLLNEKDLTALLFFDLNDVNDSMLDIVDSDDPISDQIQTIAEFMTAFRDTADAFQEDNLLGKLSSNDLNTIYSHAQYNYVQISRIFLENGFINTEQFIHILFNPLVVSKHHFWSIAQALEKAQENAAVYRENFERLRRQGAFKEHEAESLIEFLEDSDCICPKVVTTLVEHAQSADKIFQCAETILFNYGLTGDPSTTTRNFIQICRNIDALHCCMDLIESFSYFSCSQILFDQIIQISENHPEMETQTIWHTLRALLNQDMGVETMSVGTAWRKQVLSNLIVSLIQNEAYKSLRSDSSRYSALLLQLVDEKVGVRPIWSAIKEPIAEEIEDRYLLCYEALDQKSKQIMTSMTHFRPDSLSQIRQTQADQIDLGIHPYSPLAVISQILTANQEIAPCVIQAQQYKQYCMTLIDEKPIFGNIENTTFKQLCASVAHRFRTDTELRKEWVESENYRNLLSNILSRPRLAIESSLPKRSFDQMSGKNSETNSEIHAKRIRLTEQIPTALLV